MTGGRQYPRSRRTPVFTRRFDREAGLAQGRQRRLELGGDDGEVAPWRRHRVRLWHQVDLRPLSFQPGELGQGGRRLHALEAEQLEQLGRALDLFRRDLDPDVVKHWSSLEGGAERFAKSARLTPTCNVLSATMQSWR